MKRTCQTTDSTLLQRPAEAEPKQGEIITIEVPKDFNMLASLLGTAVFSSTRVESVTFLGYTVADVYYRKDSLKSEGRAEMVSRCGIGQCRGGLEDSQNR